MSIRRWCAPLLLIVTASCGCRSPYYQDRGTAVGGLGGAGIGALVGSSSGHAGTGALIGAGVGALAGNMVGGALDDVEARNRAQIAATMGRPVAAGAATPAEVVAMSRAGVNPQLIVNYINTSGVAQSIGPQDVIYLTQQGVPPAVIQAMQTPRMAQRQPLCSRDLHRGQSSLRMRTMVRRRSIQLPAAAPALADHESAGASVSRID